MRVSTVFIAFAAAMPAFGRPMHGRLNYSQYLNELDTTQADLDEWRSKFGDVAQKNGWMPVVEARSAVEHEEDLRQRIFLTKQSIATIQAVNPLATFSIMSPFSALTDDEFHTYVMNAYVRGNNLTHSGSRQLRSAVRSDLRSQDPSFSATAKSLLHSVLNMIQPTRNIGFKDRLKKSSKSPKSFKFSDFWTWVPQRPTQIATPDAAVTSPALIKARSDSVDWTTSKCMARIQTQGACGSCWSFATVSVVESAQCIANGAQALTKFSEQQLVSCDTRNQGCNGGFPTFAYKYVQENGLCTADKYPYTGYASSCRIGCAAKNTGLKGFATVSSQNGLLHALTEHPVLVAVASGNNVWKQYTGGIVSSCGTTRPDHAVVAVGYDSASIKIRNSWGTLWGEGGYIRLARSSDSQGTCGMLSDMTTPQM